MSAPRQKSICRLLEAARGMYASSLEPTHKPLRCFPLEAKHIGSALTTPADFHSCLIDMIRNATRRVCLASLYIGTGSGKEECEFLDALASVGPQVDVTILLDENRATRPVKQNGNEKTSSAQAVHDCLQQHGLYLFPALPEPRRSLLPSPLNEIAGVFHVKSYVVDDTLILSGANLSQEYFTDRQDRYVVFTNGSLVDFYCNLVNVLCQYSFRYRDATYQRCTKQQLMKSLEQLMDGSQDTALDVDDKNVVAYAVPTFQAPEGFFSTSLDFPMDAELTRNVLLTAYEESKDTTVKLASAYLNPKPKLTSTLAQFQHLQLLTAGYKSHGFAPKPGQPRRGDWVPSIFSALYAELEEKLPHADFLYYERDGWTFHAKGLWITENDKLLAAIVGSGNYGARSEVMDVESNTILVFPSQKSELQTRLQGEWNSMCQYAHEGHAIEFPQTSWRVKAALPIIRDLF